MCKSKYKHKSDAEKSYLRSLVDPKNVKNKDKMDSSEPLLSAELILRREAVTANRCCSGGKKNGKKNDAKLKVEAMQNRRKSLLKSGTGRC